MKLQSIILASVLAVASCAPYSANQQTGYGATTSNSVRNAQNGLSQLSYYDGRVDGVDSRETQQAVLRYQGDRGLPRDGVIDDRLVSRINADLSGRTDRGDTTSPDRRVARVQESLSRLGYYEGQIDGRYDRETRRAIVDYRRDRGLQVNDQIDRELIESLDRDQVSGRPQTPYPTAGGFAPGRTLPAEARALLEQRWRNYEGLVVDLDRDGNSDVIARSAQGAGDCRNNDCEYVVLGYRRGQYHVLSSFIASDAGVLGRSTNGFSDIAYRTADSRRQVELRFDGERYRG